MTQSAKTMYFMVKIVAAHFGQKQLQVASLSETAVTKDCDNMSCEDDHGGKCCVRVGGKPGSRYHGIAGHFSMEFLNFSDAENASCKSLDEAERVARSKHHEWLANAYDWYVAPVDVWSERNSAA
ncbi:MAG: hypothetical protein ABI905_07530 [Betaproteobacteria bacterium]